MRILPQTVRVDCQMQDSDMNICLTVGESSEGKFAPGTVKSGFILGNYWLMVVSRFAFWWNGQISASEVVGLQKQIFGAGYDFVKILENHKHFFTLRPQNSQNDPRNCHIIHVMLHFPHFCVKNKLKTARNLVTLSFPTYNGERFCLAVESGNEIRFC